MKNWYQKQPNLFKKRVYNLVGLDNKRFIILIAEDPLLKISIIARSNSDSAALPSQPCQAPAGGLLVHITQLAQHCGQALKTTFTITNCACTVLGSTNKTSAIASAVQPVTSNTTALTRSASRLSRVRRGV